MRLLTQKHNWEEGGCRPNSTIHLEQETRARVHARSHFLCWVQVHYQRNGPASNFRAETFPESTPNPRAGRGCRSSSIVTVRGGLNDCSSAGPPLCFS